MAAIVLAAIALTACSDNFVDCQESNSDNVVYNPDGTLAVILQMEIPGMTTASTRAMDETPNYEELKLYLLVFEDGEGLRQFVKPTPIEVQDDTEHGPNKKLMKFQFSLEPTEKKATIHLIATDQPNFEQQIGYGTEERVIPPLYTKNGYEAYWQRIAFDYKIPSKEQVTPTIDGKENKDYSEEARDHAEAIMARLTHVPMIRNFCRVSVDNKADRFTLTGLYVLNTVDRGSVAPYVASSRKYVDYYNEVTTPEGNKKYQGRSYSEISNQGHVGSPPVGVQLINKLDDDIQTKSEGTNNEVLPVYFYERPARVNSTERTYVILRGRLIGKEKDSYYKVDLGHIREEDNPVGIFEYYNLLRNFDYRINLKSVESDGYSSLNEAANGSIFNNFSASVEARNMKSISDGEDMIFVSFTSFVFTQPYQSVDLLAQYRTDITNNEGGVERNDLITYMIGSESDNIITEVIETKDHKESPDLTGWNTYKVTGGVPTDRLQQQIVYIYRGNKAANGEAPDYGLYRVITFFSHTPWEFEHIDTYPGLWESKDDTPSWEWSEGTREIGQSAGSPLTLFFELPAGLPQALFPLEFVIEADKQNIQNAYAGNAVVRSVPANKSLFANDQLLKKDDGTEGDPPQKPTTSRIQYVKTVTWKDYFGENSEELVGTGSTIVRCRFLTITDLAQDGIGGSGTTGSSTTTLRVSNPYFDKMSKDGKNLIYHQDAFTRSTATSDPSPGLWNFSLYAWSSVVEELRSDNNEANNKANYKTTIDSLTISAPTAKTLRSGSIDIEDNAEDGAEPVTTTYSYLCTTSSNVTFTHTRKYPGSDTRQLGVYVMATTDDSYSNGTPPKLVEPTVTLELKKNDNSSTTVTLEHSTDDTTKPFTSQVYTTNKINMSAVKEVDLKVNAPDNTPVRFYKIEFYPRWGEYSSSE